MMGALLTVAGDATAKSATSKIMFMLALIEMISPACGRWQGRCQCQLQRQRFGGRGAVSERVAEALSASRRQTRCQLAGGRGAVSERAAEALSASGQQRRCQLPGGRGAVS
eukprot:366401-Chlamydomonas_euryale.AAC.8